MTKNNNSFNYTTGGQTLYHKMSMFLQTVKRNFLVSFYISVIYSLIRFFSINFKTIVSFIVFYLNELENFLFKNTSINLIQEHTVSSKIIIKDFTSLLFHIFLEALMIVVVIQVIITIYIIKKGGKQQRTEHIEGALIMPHKAFLKKFKKQINSKLSLGSLPFMKDSENLHFAIDGGTGTGKSTTLHHLIASIIKNTNDRFVVYSPSCEFIEGHYNSENSIILNPLDKRSAVWNLFAELKSNDDINNSWIYALIAESIISNNTQQDPFWKEAGRTIVSDLLKVLHIQANKHNKLPKMSEFLDSILNENVETLSKKLEGTSSKSLAEEGIRKTFLSVRATLTSDLNALKFLQDETDPNKVFSIKDWVKNNDHNKVRGIFISVSAEQQSALKNLLSCQLQILAKSILSLNRKNGNIWVIIDELPSLNRLNVIIEILSQGRKYGASCVLSLQGFSQLKAVYGVDNAQSIMQNIGTTIHFRNNDAENATYVSKRTGQTVEEKQKQTISFGARQVRDGVSQSKQKDTRPTITATDILNLDNLECILNAAGYPIIRIKQNFFKNNNKNTGYIPTSNSNIVLMKENKKIKERQQKTQHNKTQLELIPDDKKFNKKDKEEIKDKDTKELY